MSTAAILLAAGSGSRFETSGGRTHKLLTLFRGRPLVAWAAESALAAGLETTFVVWGAVDIAGSVPAGTTLLHNPAWEQGQAGSLAVGLDAAAGAGFDAVVVGLGDQPLVPPEAWSAVAAATSPIAVATYEGLRRNPVRLAAEVWPLLDPSGDEGARSLMRRRPDLVEEVACSGDPADVDTVEDLDQWS